jgi:hypothetical protein
MSWTLAPADIYDRIREALFRHKSEYFHPEYPDDWLEDRLRRFLPQLPYYATDCVLLRPVAKRGFLCLEQMLSLGRPSVRHARAMAALAYDLAMRLALPILAESFHPLRHRLAGNVSEEELQFPVLNRSARDPWDAPAGTPRAHAALDELLDSLPREVESHVSPFNATLYFAKERRNALEIVTAVGNYARVVHVSSASQAFTRQLHAALAAADPSNTAQQERRVGEPRINYITTIPRRHALERLRRRDRDDPVDRAVLLHGRLHAF